MASTGGRGRYLRTSISLDTRVNQLARTAGDFPVLLFTWMIPHANDDATISGDPEVVKMLVLPGLEKSVEDVAAALDAIDAAGLLEKWDRENNVIYFKPHSFYRCQTYINAANRRRAPGSAVTPTPTSSSTTTTTVAGPSRGEGANASDAAAAERAFEQEFGRPPLDSERVLLQSWADEWPLDVLLEAMLVAKKRGNPKAVYVAGILNNWRRDGITTLDDVARHEGSLARTDAGRGDGDEFVADR